MATTADSDASVRQPPTPTSLAFENIRFQTNKGKELLHGVSGYVAPGECCGVLGPSGSGKTCLLDVLSLRKKKGGYLKEGKVLYGGKPAKSRARGSACYIGQEDLLLPAFTVRETVTFAAKLDYGYGIAKTQMEKLVDDVLTETGLHSSANVRVGDAVAGKGISGGQRRRLMIAVELVSCPSILILDEPTSGLDFASAFGVMEQLRSLADLGHTVLAVIHQPSSQIWSLFNKVGFLSDGALAYFGSRDNLVSYIALQGFRCPEFYNPSEFVMELLSPTNDMEESQSTVLNEAFLTSDILQDIQKCINNAQNSPEKAPTVTTSSLSLADHVPTVRLCTSANILLQRNMIDLVRNPSVLLLRLVLIWITTIVIGLTFLRIGERLNDESLRSRGSAMFFLPVFSGFVSVALMPYFLSSRAVIMNEIKNGRYSVWAYGLSYLPPMILSACIIAITVTIISFYMLAFRNFGEYFLMMLINFLMAEFIVAACGTIVGHYLIGILMVIAVMSIGLVVQGYLIVFDHIHPAIRWLGYITPNRYVFRALMRNELGGIGNLSSEFYPNGEAYLDYLGFNQEIFQSFWIDAAISASFIFGFLGAFLLGLRTWQN